MWVPDRSAKLTKELFLDCLIQYVPDNQSTKKLISVSELNGENPHSSSLRSFDSSGNPVSIAQNSHSSSNNDNNILSFWAPKFANKIDTQITDKVETANHSEVSKAKKDETILPAKLQGLLQTFFQKKYGYNITGYTVGKERIKFETKDKRCMFKKRKTGVDEHKSNHVYFVVFTNNLYHIQGCYDRVDCYENGLPGITKLGLISDEEIEKEFREWKTHSHYQNWYQVAESWTDDLFNDNKVLKEQIMSGEYQSADETPNTPKTKQSKKKQTKRKTNDSNQNIKII